MRRKVNHFSKGLVHWSSLGCLVLQRKCVSSGGHLVRYKTITSSNSTTLPGGAIRLLQTGADSVIDPQDISFESETGNFTDDHQTNEGFMREALNAARTTSVPKVFQDVVSVDPYARARVVAFVKRYNSEVQDSKDIFVTQELVDESGERKIYHTHVSVPIQYPKEGNESTTLTAHGISFECKEAELLAAMHAEYIIDFLGYHLYTLENMQRKHALAARRSGRWAPSPDDTNFSNPSEDHFPLPLRRASKDETEGGKWQLLESVATSFYSTSPAILSPCVLDPSSKTRVKNLLHSVRFHMNQLCVTKRCKGQPVAGKEKVFYESSILLPQSLVGKGVRIHGKGKATDRETAILLACMHTEMLLDSLHVCVFPNQETLQKQHAVACWQYGRPAPLSGAIPKVPEDVPELPLPLKQVPSGEVRFSPLSPEEQLVRSHETLARQISEMIDTDVVEINAVAELVGFLKRHSSLRPDDPFFYESLPNKMIKATVVLPLLGSFGARGGVGMGSTAETAAALAAMHALDVLSALGVTLEPEQEKKDSREWGNRRHKLLHSPLPAETVQEGVASPPGRREASGGIKRLIDSRTSTTESVKAAAKNNADASSTARVPADQTTESTPKKRTVKRAQIKSPTAPHGGGSATPTEPNSTKEKKSTSPPEVKKEPSLKHCWSLEPDTADGFILVTLGETANPLPNALRSPRAIDPRSQLRIGEYLNDLGRRFEDVFSHKTETTSEGKLRKICYGALPLPGHFGERIAYGEGHSEKEAERLAAMHAELILDCFGVPLFRSTETQSAHAEECASVGRYAPLPGLDRSIPTDTPTPPPLRSAIPPPKRTVKRLTPVQAKETKSSEEVEGGGKQDESVEPQTTAETPPPRQPKRYTNVSEDELDALSKYRVQYYLGRQQASLGTLVSDQVEFIVEMGKGSISHRCLLTVPLPGGGEMVAEGMAVSKKDAETVAWMHAERLLDQMNIPLFDNLPGYQRYHSQRVTKLGRSAPVGPDTQAPHVLEPALPLRLHYSLRTVPVERPTPPPAPSNSKGLQEDPKGDEVWEKYIENCTEYIFFKKQEEANLFFDLERVPRTGDSCIDTALNEMESTTPPENIKLHLQLYCNAANYSYPSYWHSHMVGTALHRVQYTRIPVPGFEFLTAQGVGSKKETSERKAALHALYLLKRVDPNYLTYNEIAVEKLEMSTEVTDTNKIKELELPVVNIKSRPSPVDESPSARKRSGSESVNLYNKKVKDFTMDGKKQLVHLYTLCAEVPPPEAVHYVTCTDEIPTYRTTISVEGDNGAMIKAESKGLGATENEETAYERLYLMLLEKTTLMPHLSEIMKQHQNSGVSGIPSISLTEDQKTSMKEVIAELLPLAEAGTTNDEAVHNTQGDTVPQEEEGEESIGQFKAASTEAAQQQLSCDLLARLTAKVTNPVYLEQYAKRRQVLSITEKREEILSAIQENPVVIICGTTGCGKTTQVPQFILDAATESGDGGKCSILVTQPRRLSAVSIAQRVAAERLERIGDSCGYIVRFDAKVGTNINFCTVGILMRMLHTSPTLEHLNYLIIDEIHERDMNSDFLLILTKELRHTRPDLKVILMSATLQANQFVDYFDNAPIINVEGYTFPVKELYLEDLAQLAEAEGVTSPLLKEASRFTAEEERERLNETVDNWLEKDFNALKSAQGTRKYDVLTADTEIDFVALQFAVDQATRMADLSDSSILVFLPGWEEITKAKDILERDSRFNIICLHSSISSEEQQRCFLPPPSGKLKLILSTNIAESGITIDDVGAVIDLGRVKEKAFFSRRGNTYGGKGTVGSLSQLLTVYASRANCVQRRGRVGRTRPGVCIRLYTKQHYDNLHQFQTPEMLRTPLDSLCLLVLALRFGDPADFLVKAIEPPESSQIEAAMTRLMQLGAVSPERSLTTLGDTLSRLPIHPRWGKLILLGCFFRTLDPALTVASVVDQSDVFLTSREVREAVRLHRLHFSCGSMSDFLSTVNAYNFWIGAREKLSSTELTGALNERWLSVPQLLLVARCKRQFYKILGDMRYIRVKQPTALTTTDESAEEDDAFVDTSYYSKQSSGPLLKALIASCLLPDVCMSYGKRRFRSKSELHVHPSTDSVVNKTNFKKTGQQFFAYSDLYLAREGDKVTARGISHVPFWGLILFSSINLWSSYDTTAGLTFLDEWILYHIPFSDYEVLRKFKLCLDYCLTVGLSEPLNGDHSNTFWKVQKIVKELVSSPIRTLHTPEPVPEPDCLIPASNSLKFFFSHQKKEKEDLSEDE